MKNDCRSYLVVEHNGTIYPCDFYVENDLLLGNIMTGEWNDFLDSKIYKKFGKRKRELVKECLQCPCLDLCAGCCPKNRSGRGEKPGPSALCEGWKIFFSHTLDRFKIIAGQIKKEREEEGNFIRSAQGAKISPAETLKTGRNAPCPCGSGKKYKKCCGK
jgi:uncharacterized protein